MKIVVAFVGILAAALAEKEAPYPPSGWKPDGPQFTYPPPTPPREYGPASTPAPTEQPTQAPQEPAATYIPSEETTQPSNGGYQRYQSQRLARPSAPQGHGQFFIITPQGQLQHVPIAVPQATDKDAEAVEPRTNADRTPTAGRLVQRPSPGKPSPSQQKDGTAATPERVPVQGQPQFVAFIPAVPLDRLQSAAKGQPAAPQNGQYHVIRPDGKLQRVQYMNVLGADNRLTANVQYQEVEPLRGPLYTFGSPLVRVL